MRSWGFSGVEITVWAVVGITSSLLGYVIPFIASSVVLITVSKLMKKL